MKKRGRLPNVSYFAFTATPKPKTLELFGRKRPDGKFEPFSLYSMRQAIEEKFILDVLENYTTYTVLLQPVEEDQGRPQLRPGEGDCPAQVVRGPPRAHHPQEGGDHGGALPSSNVMPRIGGKAKAMIVTRSRLHAVRYKLAVDEYLKEKGYPFRALVAFSGTVKDGGADYTEAGMKRLRQGRRLPRRPRRDVQAERVSSC